MVESEPVLVLLPGLDGTPVLYRPLLDHLEQRTRFLSYPQELPSTYDDLLPLVLAALPTKEPFILAGWSFSGPLALMAATEAPPMLKGVILAATFVCKPVFYLPSWVRFFSRPIIFKHFSVLSRLKAFILGDSSKVLSALIHEAHSQVPPEVMAQRVRETFTVNVEAELQSCSVPILYLQGSRDVVVPSWNLRRIQKLRPDVKASMIKGSHQALATNPAASASAISAFVRDHSALY